MNLAPSEGEENLMRESRNLWKRYWPSAHEGIFLCFKLNASLSLSLIVDPRRRVRCFAIIETPFIPSADNARSSRAEGEREGSGQKATKAAAL